MQKGWVLVQVRRAVDEVFAAANTREDFTLENICHQLRSTGIARSVAAEYARPDWERRRMEIPSRREKFKAVVDRLFSQGVPVGDITRRRVSEVAGTDLRQDQWFGEMVRAAWRQHQDRCKDATPQLPEHVDVMLAPDARFDPNADELDLRVGGGNILRRSRLRPDIAQIAWPLLCEAALAGQLAASTITNCFYGYKWAGEMLGKHLPDVTTATLEALQRAWLAYEDGGESCERSHIKGALIRLFSRLTMLAEGRPMIDRRQMFLITAWLSVNAQARRREPCGDHLSAGELDAVIAACLTDVKLGVDFLEGQTDLLSLSTWPGAKNSAVPLIRWGLALMILIMLLTGLRRQSVLNLRVGDWTALHPGLFALVWSHGKKREEKVAVLPNTLAGLLDHYVEQTRELRQDLNSDLVFLFGTGAGHWQAGLPASALASKLLDFVRRHNLVRAGRDITLTCTMLRRTFVTRELYDGRSLWALRLQLGHQHISSTRSYGKFDMYEHPSQVSPALDNYGRRALTLWRGPVVLDSLNPGERARLLELRTLRDQDVGLCRQANCTKIAEGSLPPCSLCEHLVTGREFFGAWDAEQRRREHVLARLEGVPGREPLLAHRRREYALFAANYARLKGEVN